MTINAYLRPLILGKNWFFGYLHQTFTAMEIPFQSRTSEESSVLVHKVIPKICGELLMQDRRQALHVFDAGLKKPFKSVALSMIPALVHSLAHI
ncbi:hypothetical protein [Paraherbaspirillum soli]|uniref:Uncharacterized protein n=1 Tax=Paraherbaspirillum soli TaxID=631222 RepID=A0ABW0M8H1_9BURK